MKNAQNNNNNIAIVTDSTTSLTEELVSAIAALIAKVCIGKNIFVTAAGMTALTAAKAVVASKMESTGIFTKAPGKKLENFRHVKVAASPASWALNNSQEIIVIGSSEKMKTVISAATEHGRTVYAIADDGTFTQHAGKVEAVVEKKEATKMDKNTNDAKAVLNNKVAEVKAAADAAAASIDEKKAALASLEEKQKDIKAQISALKEEIKSEEKIASSAALKAEAVKAIADDALAQIAKVLGEDKKPAKKAAPVEKKEVEDVATIKEAVDELRNDPEEQAVVAEDVALLDDDEISPVVAGEKHEDAKHGVTFKFVGQTFEVINATEFNPDDFDLLPREDCIIALAKAKNAGYVRQIAA